MKKQVGEIKLTKKQIGFAKDYVKTGHITKSAMKNYNVKNERVAQTIGSENLSKPMIQKYIKSIADSLPNELLIEKHLALLNKEEVITKNNMTTGEVDVIPTGQIDTQAVKAGLDMAYKLKGLFNDNTLNLNVSVNEDTMRELNSEIKAYLNGKNKPNTSKQ